MCGGAYIFAEKTMMVGSRLITFNYYDYKRDLLVR